MTKDYQENESKLEHIISYLLIIGVIIAVLLEIIGMALYFGAFGNLQYSQSSNVYVTTFLLSPPKKFKASLQHKTRYYS